MAVKKVGVVRFLGTNCDQDVMQACRQVGLDPEYIWYQNQFDWKDYLALFLPGGFSHGDYLRSGALAAKSPVLTSVRSAANKGVPVLGICNGFQILCEAGLLPGVLLRNSHLRFVDKWVNLKVRGSSPDFLSKSAQSIKLPVAHGDGRYFAESDKIKELFDSEQVWFTYIDNPNGSVESIAGVLNENKNVAGLMPHPERAMADWMGGNDGLGFFETVFK